MSHYNVPRNKKTKTEDLTHQKSWSQVTFPTFKNLPYLLTLTTFKWGIQLIFLPLSLNKSNGAETTHEINWALSPSIRFDDHK